MSELDDVLARLVEAYGLHKVCTALMVIGYGRPSTLRRTGKTASRLARGRMPQRPWTPHCRVRQL